MKENGSRDLCRLLPFCFFPVVEYIRHVFQCPSDKIFDVRHQGFACFRQLVFYAGRYFGIDCPRNKSVGLQCPQRYGQHTLRDVGDCLLDIAETHCSIRVQCDHNKHRPLVAEPAQDVPDGTSSGRMKIFHIFLVCSVLYINNGYIDVSSLFRGAFLFYRIRLLIFAVQK